MKRVSYSLVVVVLLLFGSHRASAQNPSVTFSLLQDMSFGTVPTNTTVTVPVSAPGAGEVESTFGTNGNKNGTASFDFSLPRRLWSGSNSIPISCGRNSAVYNSTNSLSGSTGFDPSQGLSGIPVSPNAPSAIYFWIGGTISPDCGQAAGTYTGTIMVSGSIVLSNGKTVIETQPIVISVTVIQTLSLASTGSLDFGKIVAGTTPSSLSPQTNPSAPMFTAVGSPGRRISVSYDAVVSLRDESGRKLTFRPTVSGASVKTDQASSTGVASGTDVELNGDTEGYYYFWLGGSLDRIRNSQPSGNYRGKFTLSATY